MIATRPHVLDAAIDPARADDFEASFDDDTMGERVEAFVAQAPTYEEALNRARDFAAEEKFHHRPQSACQGASIPIAPGAPIARSRRD